MIPKKIHFCWFGGEKPDYIFQCISTWKKFLPDYEIIEWGNDSLKKIDAEFVKSAFAAKKYAFVSDYVRAYALFNEGGIYLDTDVEIKESLDEFLTCQAFSGFEADGHPFTAVWGSVKGHSWPRKTLEYYADKIFDNNFSTNTEIVSDLLAQDYGINRNIDRLQFGIDGVVIYPSHTFCLDLPKNYATHHFNGSWLDHKKEISYKEVVHAQYFSKKTSELRISESDTYKIIDSYMNKMSTKKRLKFALKILIHIINNISAPKTPSSDHKNEY